MRPVRSRGRTEGEDDADRPTVSGLGGRVVHPEVGGVGVEQHELTLDAHAGGRESIEGFGGALVGPDHLSGHAFGRRRPDAGKARGDHRLTADHHAGRLEGKGVDRHRLEVHVLETQGAHLVGEVPSSRVVGPGARPGEPQLRVRARHREEVVVDGLRISLGKEVIDGLVEGRFRRRLGCGGQQQQEQQAEWKNEQR